MEDVSLCRIRLTIASAWSRTSSSRIRGAWRLISGVWPNLCCREATTSSSSPTSKLAIEVQITGLRCGNMPSLFMSFKVAYFGLYVSVSHMCFLFISPCHQGVTSCILAPDSSKRLILSSTHSYLYCTYCYCSYFMPFKEYAQFLNTYSYIL